jgi:perosamine synthetase
MLSQVTLARKKGDFNNYKKVGYNYRMPSINAALGIGQLNNLKKFIKEKIFLFKIYKRMFKDSEIKIFKQPKNCKSNYWVQLLFLDRNNSKKRKKIINFYKKNRIELKSSWKLISSISHFSAFPKSNLSQAAYLSKNIINLPSMM